MKRSIEQNLVSLGVVGGGLLVVLIAVIFAVQHALGGNLSRIEKSTLPSEQAMTGLERSVARVFEREVQMLATNSTSELDAYRDRRSIEAELTNARRVLESSLPSIIDKSAAGEHSRALDGSARDMLSTDAALLESIDRRHAAQHAFDDKTAAAMTELQKLIQQAKAVAGTAHLEYVLELRRIDRDSSRDQVKKLVHGRARAQQEAASSFVLSVLQLGQLVGKVALAKTVDDLNSIAANELSQNLSRGRAQLGTLLANFEDGDAEFVRAKEIERNLELLAASISAEKDPASLINLRRAVVSEAVTSARLRGSAQKTVAGFTEQLTELQSIVAGEAVKSAASAARTLWVVRLGSLAMLAAAAAIGLRSSRQIRDSVLGLRQQNERLEAMGEELRNMNEGLEGLVAERSAELVRRERSMRLILDAMDEGLLTVALDGHLEGDCSKAAVAWFGAPKPGTLAAEYLFPEGKARATFEVGFQQIAEDVLPFEASADGMPKHLERDGRSFHLAYRQVTEDERFRAVLIVIADVTAQIEAEQRARDAREQNALVSNLLKDMPGFRSFVLDCERLLAELRGSHERAHALSTLHTLKGNTAVFGMESMARKCHELEERVIERLGGATEQEIAGLTALFRSRLARIEELLTSDSAIQVQDADYGELLSGLQKRRDHRELVALVESWKWLRTSVLLGRLATQVRRVAERCGKDVDVTVEHDHLRLTPGPLDAFLSTLVHVVRNAVDHGIEAADVREAAGKPRVGHILLRTSVQGNGAFALEIADDGRGLDLAALEEAAKKNGIVVHGREEIIAAMFRAGVTSREQATEVSGRGVGLDAVMTACRAADGEIQVETESGRGTTFRFVFPRQKVDVRSSPRAPGYTRSIRPTAARESA